MTLRENAVLVIPRSMISHLEEAMSLAETAGYNIVSMVKARYEGYIKKGLLDSIVSEVAERGASTIIYYGSLKPSAAFILMKHSKARVVDRVMLILEIFAKHARSKEALLQIEAARIRHEIPLVRELVRRSKLGELPGFLGPGKYAIDEYYRHLTRRLSRIRRELDELKKLRESRLKSRSRSGIMHVAIVGYASAGKTTLFNALTGYNMPVGPEYFTTLQPKHGTVKGVSTPNGGKVVAVDTVGFIRDVPPEIVEAFHATLAEIRYADAILFVVDASESESEIREKVAAGFNTLARIGSLGLPTVIALNKVDVASRVDEKEALVKRIAFTVPGVKAVVRVSATKGYGIEELLGILLSLLSPH